VEHGSVGVIYRTLDSNIYLFRISRNHLKNMPRYRKCIKHLVIKSWLLIYFPILLPGLLCNSQQISSKISKDINVHEWIGHHFAKGTVPPFSFVYGGKESGTFIREWNYQVEIQPGVHPNIEKYLFTYRDPQGGLVVKCYVTVFNDFQAVEWVLKFSNASSENTPILQKVQVLDNEFITIRNSFTTLHHIQGSKGGKDDFTPAEDTLEIRKTVRLTPAGGRSSDNTAFPIFNIKNQLSSGFVVAIGWTGKWYTDICQTGEDILSLKAGMEKMKLILYPREEIRTPSICLLFWKGEEPMTGNNKFRKFVLIHKTRTNLVQLPLCASLSPNSPSPCNGFFGCLSDSFAISKIEKLKQDDIVPDVCWIDAGWYQDGGDNWQIVGNWNADKKRFPDGLKPVSDAIHAIGSKFLLWFEPERVVEGTLLDMEHANWLISLPGDKRNVYSGKKDYLFNLGLDEARFWLTDYISEFIKKEGIDFFRQDLNIDPANYWDVNDLPDRIGISEIRHIEGLYAFWDSLLVRFPNLIIDNCASGGRRIDLETISRSSPLWRSDYLMDEPEGLQNHTYGLNYYLPFHGTGNLTTAPYDFRSSMSSTMVLFWDIRNTGNSLQQMQKCMNDFKRLRPYYSGDYYPLTGTKNLLKDDIWLAYQLNRSEDEDGIIMAFRRKNCPEESILVKLHGLNKNADYELFDEDSGKKVIKKGEELLNGIKISLSEKQKSLLISYEKKEK
jgi:alpha-galactosidase